MKSPIPALLLMGLLLGCEQLPGNEHGHEGEPVLEAKGPHGGKMFAADELQLELRIEEEDGPPMFLAYVYDAQGSPLSPEAAELSVELQRFAGRTETIPFRAELNHLRGEGVVREPHSFLAIIALRMNGQNHRWEWEQTEFRVVLTPEAVEAAKIRVSPAGPATISLSVTAPGEVRLNAERVLMVRPRFPGMVTNLSKPMGAGVKKGEVLAVVQSNESLRDYTIEAPMDGTIVARTGAVGAAVGTDASLYTLADLSTVWVDFAIHPHDIGLVKAGQRVRLEATTRSGLVKDATIDYVGPLLEHHTRASYARVVLPNPDGRWQPGLYVVAKVFVDEVEPAVTVLNDAIVRTKFGPAVFLAQGSSFEIQPIETGRTDGVTTEVLSGLEAGAQIVVENSYLLKAELGRSEATHDH